MATEPRGSTANLFRPDNRWISSRRLINDCPARFPSAWDWKRKKQGAEICRSRREWGELSGEEENSPHPDPLPQDGERGSERMGLRYSGEMPDTVWRKWRQETADSVCEIRTATRVRSHDSSARVHAGGGESASPCGPRDFQAGIRNSGNLDDQAYRTSRSGLI